MSYCPHPQITPPALRRKRIIGASFGLLASFVLTLSLAAQPVPASAAGSTSTGDTSDRLAGSTQNEHPIVLNPLDVNSTRDVGYGAATTASTSRVVQNYIDVPQTVNVVTAQYIQDYAVQDVRQLLEFTPNITFGLPTNPNSTRIRGSIVNTTYVDGVASPYSLTAEPLDFFDRIEIVKGPSSAAFGLGQPGGLLNYVSKTPQKIDNTEFYIGFGEWDNFRTGLDLQRVDSHNEKLSYRVVAFGDKGGYEAPNIQHSGYGTQFAARYDNDPTFRIDLITAYSSTNFPSEQFTNTIWTNATIYEAYQIELLGHATYAYLPGTVFPNGSIFGVSGQLPPPGTEVGLFGTGKLAAKDSNGNPSDFFSSGSTVNDSRNTLVLNKTLLDGHLNVRDAVTLEFETVNTIDETPASQIAVPGSANTFPDAAAGNPSYGEPAGFTLTGYGTSPGYQGIPGQPFFGLGYSPTRTQGNSSNRNNELDLLGTWKLPFGMELQALAGGDIYDTESSSLSWAWPAVVPGSGLQYVVNLYGSNNPAIPIPSTYTFSGNSNTHQWGDGAYVQGDLKLFNGMLDLNAGWRIDYFDSVVRNYLTNAYSNSGWLTTKGAPRAAITLKPLPWLSFYELYSVHKDPSQFTTEYFLSSGTEYGPALQALYPQGTLEAYQPGGTTIESGAKVSLFNGRVYASVAIFHAISTGQLHPIVADTFLNPDGTVSQIGVEQVTGTNVHGVEAEVFGQITDRLSGIINYGQAHGYFPPFANGTPDEVDPSATISGHLKLDLGNLRGDGFYVNFGGEGFGPYYIYQGIYQNQNVSLYYGSWQYLLDAGVGFRWRTGRYRQSVLFDCTNLTDAQVSVGTVSAWEIEPKRQWMVTYRVAY